MKTILLLVALLAGCTGNVRNASSIAVYDFGHALPNSGKSELPAGLDGKIALEVRAVSWLDAPIDYRLAYDDPFRRRQYANSRWAGTPAALLNPLLRQQLGMAAVNGGSSADCLLRVEIQEFAQVFDSLENSRGILRGHATLADSKRRTIAEHALSIDKAAGTPDAQGGARALIGAAQELGRDLAAWLDQLDKTNDLARCRTGR